MKSASRKPGHAAAVRAYLQGLKPGETASTWEIATATQIGRRQVNTVLSDMARRGEAERPEPGRYRLTGRAYQARPAEIKKKILRAISTKGGFCYREISILTDADKTYIGDVVRGLVEAGDVERLPDQWNQEIGGVEARFRVRRREEFYLKHVMGKPDGQKKKKRKR